MATKYPIPDLKFYFHRARYSIFIGTRWFVCEMRDFVKIMYYMFCFKLSSVDDDFMTKKEHHKPLKELSIYVFGFRNDVHRHMIN